MNFGEWSITDVATTGNTQLYFLSADWFEEGRIEAVGEKYGKLRARKLEQEMENGVPWGGWNTETVEALRSTIFEGNFSQKVNESIVIRHTCNKKYLELPSHMFTMCHIQMSF